MSRKHEKTRDAIFSDPVRANIRWDDVAAFLIWLGAAETLGGGSMVGYTLNGVRAVLHKPHPGNELTKPGVRAVREFLAKAGEAP